MPSDHDSNAAASNNATAAGPFLRPSTTTGCPGLTPVLLMCSTSLMSASEVRKPAHVSGQGVWREKRADALAQPAAVTQGQAAHSLTDGQVGVVHEGCYGRQHLGCTGRGRIGGLVLEMEERCSPTWEGLANPGAQLAKSATPPTNPAPD